MHDERPAARGVRIDKGGLAAPKQEGRRRTDDATEGDQISGPETGQDRGATKQETRAEATISRQDWGQAGLGAQPMRGTGVQLSMHKVGRREAWAQ